MVSNARYAGMNREASSSGVIDVVASRQGPLTMDDICRANSCQALALRCCHAVSSDFRNFNALRHSLDSQHARYDNSAQSLTASRG
jgi:hypothetical protein